MIGACLFPTSIGDCAIAWRENVVVGTHLPEKTPRSTIERLSARTGAVLAEPTSAVRSAMQLITELLGGNRVDLSSVAFELGQVAPFAARVYAQACTVGAGETTTYGAIAKELGDASLARQVGQALGRNPLPIIVPCHRVLGANGKLVGFSADGGVHMKLKMLEIERTQIADGSGLFDDLPYAAKPGR